MREHRTALLSMTKEANRMIPRPGGKHALGILSDTKTGGRLMAGKVTLQIIILFRQVIKVPLTPSVRWGDEEGEGHTALANEIAAKNMASQMTLLKTCPATLSVSCWSVN